MGGCSRLEAGGRGGGGNGAGFGHHLKDAAAGAVQGAGDDVDAEAARTELEDADAARGRIGNLDAVAAVDIGEGAEGVRADQQTEGVGDGGLLRDIDAGAAEGSDQKGGRGIADEADEMIEGRSAGVGGGVTVA